MKYKSLNKNFALGNCLFGSGNITKNADRDKRLGLFRL